MLCSLRKKAIGFAPVASNSALASASRGKATTVSRLLWDPERSQELEDQVLRGGPVLILGAAREWDLSTHSLCRLYECFRQIKVAVEVAIGGGDYRDLYREVAMPERKFQADEIVPLRLLLDHIKKKESDVATASRQDFTLYLAQKDIHDVLPELAVDPRLLPLKVISQRLYQQSIWLGPKGTHTPLHCDPYFNLLFQVWGKKRIRIYRPEHRSSLYPFPRGPLRNTSQIDALDPESPSFPAFAQVPFYECVLRPGEMLYMPQRFWHEVTAIEGESFIAKACYETYTKWSAMGAAKPMELRAHAFVSTAIVMIAAAAYYALATDSGNTPIPVEPGSSATRNIFYPFSWHCTVAVYPRWQARYIDWFFTTPLLLLDILLIAGVSFGTALWILFADVAMIVVGLFGAITTGKSKWGWFAAGCIFQILICYGVIVPGTAAARLRSPVLTKYYLGFAGYLLIIWIGYPIVWGLAEGSNSITADAEAASYAALDIAAKVVFGWALMLATPVFHRAQLEEESRLDGGAVNALTTPINDVWGTSKVPEATTHSLSSAEYDAPAVTPAPTTV